MPTSLIKGRVVRIELRRPNDEKILLIETERHSSFDWEMPGGKVEPNETVMQAALRELWEETRLRAKLRLIRYARRAIPQNLDIFWEHYMFTGLYSGGVIQLESPVAEHHWSSVTEALHQCTDWWTKHYLSSIRL